MWHQNENGNEAKIKNHICIFCGHPLSYKSKIFFCTTIINIVAADILGILYECFLTTKSKKLLIPPTKEKKVWAMLSIFDYPIILIYLIAAPWWHMPTPGSPSNQGSRSFSARVSWHSTVDSSDSIPTDLYSRKASRRWSPHSFYVF